MENRENIMEDIIFKLEFIHELEDDEQVKQLKEVKYSQMDKAEVTSEYAAEIITMHIHIKMALQDEDYEFCALVRDYVDIITRSYILDLQKYYDLCDKDMEDIKIIMEETLK
jgi:hypothetical protein